MTLPDLLAELDKLNRADKLRVIQYLVHALEMEFNEGRPSAANLANRTFEVWLPPQDAGRAIATMHKALQDYRKRKRIST